MEDCVFCKIIQGQIPCYKVFEDKETVAFLDIKPHAPGHTVVIPKKHGVTAFDFSEKEFAAIVVAARKTAQLLREKLSPDGFNIGWNQGTAAGQVVSHLHVHIFPRFLGDGGGSMHSIVKNPGNRSVEEIAKLLKE